MAVEYPQLGQGNPVIDLNRQLKLIIPPASRKGYVRNIEQNQ